MFFEPHFLKMNKNIKILYLYICAGIILLAGCAPKVAPPTGNYKNLKSQSFLVDGERYVSVYNFCQAYALNWEWNSVSHHVFFDSPRLTISLHCGSSIALINGNVEYLVTPVIFKKSNIIIPLELAKVVDDYSVARVQETGKLKLKTIVIDPGHGGKDPGAIGRGGLQEKQVTLDVALKLKRLLETEGLKVVMTREGDNFISLWKRAHIANNCKADFFISIHVNASRSQSPQGFEAYCLSEAVDDEARAVAAVENSAVDLEESNLAMHNTTSDIALWESYFSEHRAQSLQLANMLCERAAEDLNVKNRGVKTARFYVLKGVRLPAVLVEIGFVSNLAEERKLKNPEYRKQVASVLAAAILQYKSAFESANSFANQ